MYAEYEWNVRRLVERISGIIQAEKCLIMRHDPVARTLSVIPPALGVTTEQISRLGNALADSPGISSEVHRRQAPVRVRDAAQDPRAVAEGFTAMGVRNVLSVPLVAFTRGDDGRLLTRHPVGVLHVFNKSTGGDFIDEDLRLLQSLARIAVALVTAQ